MTFSVRKMARQAAIWILLGLPSVVFAQPELRFDTAQGEIVVSGLSSEEQQYVLQTPSLARLQFADHQQHPGMLISILENGDQLHIRPRFALRPGKPHRFTLDYGAADPLELNWTTDQANAAAPILASYSPHGVSVPANMLRMYLTFTEPMARGQVAKSIRLYREGHGWVDHAFLNLSTELWDRQQQRLTLLFDPGRIKLGVGPNQQIGAPLQPGAAYRLMVSGGMVSAKGAPIGEDRAIAFLASPAERSVVNAKDWHLVLPKAKSREAFVVQFGRIMDAGVATNALRVIDEAGTRVAGRVFSDGLEWRFSPTKPWSAKEYELIVAPSFEDIGGNTTYAPFDAAIGTVPVDPAPLTLRFLPN